VSRDVASCSIHPTFTTPNTLCCVYSHPNCAEPLQLELKVGGVSKAFASKYGRKPSEPSSDDGAVEPNIAIHGRVQLTKYAPTHAAACQCPIDDRSR
jgi:hypothetical protein